MPAQAVREHDRRRHEFRRLAAGEAEHEALVARALLGLLLAFGGDGIDALPDVRALRGQEVGDEDAVGMEDVAVVDVADAADRRTHDFVVVEAGFRRDFAGDDHDVALDERFAGDPALPVLREARIEDGVGDRVRHLVRVTFADRFRREDVFAHVVCGVC